MTLPKRLQPFCDTPIPVPSDGYVQLIDVMGDDSTIANAARISYGKRASEYSDTANRHLVRYLVRHRHTSPLEMCRIMLRIRMPMDTHRQHVRHRTASLNEYSTRYRPAISSMRQTPSDEWRLQSSDNKQGSDGLLVSWPDGMDMNFSPGDYLTTRQADLQDFAWEVYEERLKLGVSREQARGDLPLSTYTEMIWAMDLHNLLHYLRLRLDEKAQLEIRKYAEAISQIVRAWVPWVWEAFETYQLHATTFSSTEMEGLQYALSKMVDRESFLGDCIKGSGLGPKSREAEELKSKVNRLLP